MQLWWTNVLTNLFLICSNYVPKSVIDKLDRLVQSRPAKWNYSFSPLIYSAESSVGFGRREDCTQHAAPCVFSTAILGCMSIYNLLFCCDIILWWSSPFVHYHQCWLEASNFYWFFLSMRMQIILVSLFARLSSAPVEGEKKGESRDWTKLFTVEILGFLFGLYVVVPISFLRVISLASLLSIIGWSDLLQILRKPAAFSFAALCIIMFRLFK